MKEAQSWNARVLTAHLDQPHTVDNGPIDLPFVPRDQRNGIALLGQPPRRQRSLSLDTANMARRAAGHRAVGEVCDDGNGWFGRIDQWAFPIFANSMRPID